MGAYGAPTLKMTVLLGQLFAALACLYYMLLVHVSCKDVWHIAIAPPPLSCLQCEDDLRRLEVWRLVGPKPMTIMTKLYFAPLTRKNSSSKPKLVKKSKGKDGRLRVVPWLILGLLFETPLYTSCGVTYYWCICFLRQDAKLLWWLLELTPWSLVWRWLRFYQQPGRDLLVIFIRRLCTKGLIIWGA